jgi:CTP:molybdopterin cytidylyltransferase MocA
VSADVDPGLPVAGLIILAAGSASRMGSAKQLLPFGKGTLLSQAIDGGVAGGFSPIVVVLGARADMIAAALQDKPGITITINDRWENGMGSSIRAGFETLLRLAPEITVAGISLADQPCVNGRHLLEMRQVQHQKSAEIVAAEYHGQPGVPALFGSAAFPLLQDLAPESGARHLLRNGRIPVVCYSLPEAAIDIDTPDDLEQLKMQSP